MQSIPGLNSRIYCIDHNPTPISRTSNQINTGINDISAWAALPRWQSHLIKCIGSRNRFSNKIDAKQNFHISFHVCQILHANLSWNLPSSFWIWHQGWSSYLSTPLMRNHNGAPWGCCIICSKFATLNYFFFFTTMVRTIHQVLSQW